ncbi:hypothetical protein WDW86_18685 [Bdellovibrionota bacterium FG-2]
MKRRNADGKFHFVIACALGLSLVFFPACAGKGVRSAQELTQPKTPQEYKVWLDSACSLGRTTKGVKGSVWLKAKSKEASGQFPANVEAKATAEGSELRLEVTNLLGGTEALISVKNQTYRIEVPAQNKVLEQGQVSWGGIPLRWATELFLGRIPCPSGSAESADSKVEIDSTGRLDVSIPRTLEGDAERFIYSFRSWAGRPWPEALKWERKGSIPLVVEFTFDDPEDRTAIPRKWEAKSARGEVKVRWKDREIL